MLLQLIMTLLLLFGIIITSVQNSVPMDLKFMFWQLQAPLSALVIYSSLVGMAIVAVLTLPKLVSNYFKIRRLNNEINVLKEEAVEKGKQDIEEK